MNRRLLTLVFCFIVVLALAVLASSLHDVNFQPGRSYALDTPSPAAIALPSFQQVLMETPLWKILAFWLVFMVNLVLFILLLPPELRKRILRQLLSFTVGVLVLVLALRYRILELPEFITEPAEQMGQGLPGPASDSSLPTFSPPPIPPWLTYILSLLALWALIALAWFLYRRWRRSRSHRLSPLGEIADIARSSLDDLKTGRHWGDVVIETYVRMSDAVSSKRGLHRGSATTPREFADRLTRAGLPGEAVAGLTRLFEAVRYGGRKSSEPEVREARACLESILRACGASA